MKALNEIQVFPTDFPPSFEDDLNNVAYPVTILVSSTNPFFACLNHIIVPRRDFYDKNA